MSDKEIYNGPLYVEEEVDGCIVYRMVLDIDEATKEEAGKAALAEILNIQMISNDRRQQEFKKLEKRLDRNSILLFVSGLIYIIWVL